MKSSLLPVLLAALQVSVSLSKSIEPRASTANLDDDLATFRGWTSWSLVAFKKPGYGADWFNEKNVLKQADALAKDFKDVGYTQINLDSGWQAEKLDQYGRHQLSEVRFPSGMEHLVSYLKERGLKLGLYYLPGIDSRAVDSKSPVFGTKYTADQIVLCPTGAKPDCKRPPANAFGAGYALDFSHPGAQLYIDSVVDQLYKWGVTFIKYAGYIPGSSIDPNNKDFAGASSAKDLAAWRSAIDRLHASRYSSQSKIWVSAAWEIAKTQKDILKANADSHRVAIDIAAYSTVMTTFDRVIRNALVAASWSSIPANRGGTTLDLDALLLADLSLAESKTMATLWALSGTPFYSGDDLTTLSADRRAFLTNPRVLALAKQLSRNPAILFNYQQQASAQVTRSLVRRDNTESLTQCDRRVLTELHNHVCGDLHVKPQQVLAISYLSSLDMKLGKLSPAAVTANDSPPANSLESQVWFADVTGSSPPTIYLGLVNAGDQLPSDGPATVTANLKQLGLKSSLAKSYIITDVWTGSKVGTVSGELVVSSGKLQAHDSVLYALTPGGITA